MTANEVRLCMICIDSLCLVIQLILSFSVFIENKQRNLLAKTFFAMLCVSICGMSFDILAWTFEGYTTIDPLLYIFNFIDLICPSVTLIVFSKYHYLASKEKMPNFSKIHTRIILFTNFLTILLTLILTFTDLVFVFENGVMVIKFGYFIPLGVAALTIIYFIVLAIKDYSKIGKHDFIVFIGYYVLTLIAPILSVAGIRIKFGYVAMTLSFIIVYLMFQNGKIYQLELKEKYLSGVSNIDPLTGLGNRRAYDKTIDDAANMDFVGVVFCDVNGLKYTNDNKGHAFGDKLLINFAELLKSHFRKTDVFRISGDEFVVILQNIKEDDFVHKVKLFKEDIADHADICAVGIAYSKAADISESIRSAEKEMYVDKDRCYQNNKHLVRK